MVSGTGAVAVAVAVLEAEHPALVRIRWEADNQEEKESRRFAVMGTD